MVYTDSVEYLEKLRISENYNNASTNRTRRYALLDLPKKGKSSYYSLTNDKDIREIVTDDIRDVINELDKQKLSKNTINMFITLTKCLFRRMQENGFIDIDPAAKIRTLRMVDGDAYKVTPFNDAQLKAMFAVCKTKNFTGRRNLLMMKFILDTAMRISEALAVRVKDIDFKTKQISVINGKGGYDRTIPLSPALEKVLVPYIEECKKYKLIPKQ